MPPIDRNPDHIDPRLKELLEALIAQADHDCFESDHSIKFPGFDHWMLFEGYRSQDRQDALYAQGRTEAGQIVTWRRHSLHTRRVAADLVWVDHFRQPRFDGPEDLWQTLGHCARLVGLVWGGDWPQGDQNHVQLKGY